MRKLSLLLLCLLLFLNFLLTVNGTPKRVMASLFSNNPHQNGVSLMRSISARKVDVDRQGGLGATLLAGPIFLALSTLLLPFLPVLLLAPIAIAGLSPGLSSVTDAVSEATNQASPLNQALEAFNSLTSLSDSNNRPSNAGPLASESKPTLSLTKPGTKPDTGGGILSHLASLTDDGNNNDGLFPLLSTLASAGNVNSANSANSASLQNLASNALNSISNFLFSNRRSERIPWHQNPEFAKPLRNRLGVVRYLKEMFNTLRNGLRRYEIKESECQQRLVCELHQKAVGRNLRPFANVMLDAIGLESQLERSTAFGGRAKSYMRDVYKAVKHGMSEKECAEIYSRCPVSIAIEPNTNSIFSNLFRRKSHREKQQQIKLPSDFYEIDKNFYQPNLKLTKPTPIQYVQNPL